MKNSVLIRSINTLYFRENNSLILKLTSGQRKNKLIGSKFRTSNFCGLEVATPPQKQLE
jgi:hypothetical protein